MTDNNEPAWRTAISSAEEERIVYRGFDLDEVIHNLDFASTAFLIVTGNQPTPEQKRMFNALLASVVDHGISPSQAVTRYVAASGSPIQAAIGAGVLTIGDHHGGAGEIAARLFKQHSGTEPVEERAQDLLETCEDEDRQVPGYGHPMHPDGDPRATVLFDIAHEEGIASDAIELALAVESALEDKAGRPLPINVNGATAACFLDMGLSPSLARPLLIVARVPGLVAHAIEEVERERVWRVVQGGTEYDGARNRELDKDP